MVRYCCEYRSIPRPSSEESCFQGSFSQGILNPIGRMVAMECEKRECKREAKKHNTSGKILCILCYSRWWKNQRQKSEPRWIAYVKRREAVKEKNRGEKHYKQFIDKAVKKLRRRPTGAEIALMELLTAVGTEYIFQYVIRYRGYTAIVDFFVPKTQLIIEVDGGYHSEEEQARADKIRDIVLKQLGYRVLRLQNKEVYRMEPECLTKHLSA